MKKVAPIMMRTRPTRPTRPNTTPEPALFSKKLWFVATAVVLGLEVVDDTDAVSVTVTVLLDGNTTGVGVMEEVGVVEVVTEDFVEEDVVVEVEDVVDNEVEVDVVLEDEEVDVVDELASLVFGVGKRSVKGRPNCLR
jgi:hypothetical protein